MRVGLFSLIAAIGVYTCLVGNLRAAGHGCSHQRCAACDACCGICDPGLGSVRSDYSFAPTSTPEIAGSELSEASPLPSATAPPSTTAPALDFPTQSVALSGSMFAALDTKAGYIDTAIIRTQARFRFDAAYDFNRPDRAEFFYTTWQSLGGQNPDPPVGFPEPKIDRQAFWFYYEHAFHRNFSLSVDLPIVLSNPSLNRNVEGVGDLQVAAKLSLYHDWDQQLTFQLKNYIPTAGLDSIWVGTRHYSIEPGILYYGNLSDRWSVEAEVRDWISIGGAVHNGQDYAGNVLRYGVGLGYDLGCIHNHSVKPIVEFVGWSVLEGQKVDFDANNVPITPLGTDADGDTIVNIKLGTRITNCCGGSLYGGWGHSLTGDRWYRDIFRLELRKMF